MELGPLTSMNVVVGVYDFPALMAFLSILWQAVKGFESAI